MISFLKKALLTGSILVSMIASSQDRNGICEQAKKEAAPVSGIPAPFLQEVKNYQKLWLNACDAKKAIDFSRIYVELPKLGRVVSEAAQKSKEGYDESLQKFCSFAATYAPGLICPSGFNSGTANPELDSMVQLFVLAEKFGNDSDKIFFKDYYRFWGAAHNYNRPWQQETFPGESAYFDGCTTFDVIFWTSFLDELFARKSVIKNRIYVEKLEALFKAAKSTLTQIDGSICACSGKEEVLKNLDLLVKNLDSRSGELKTLAAEIKTVVASVQNGKVTVSNHKESLCGGG